MLMYYIAKSTARWPWMWETNYMVISSALASENSNFTPCVMCLALLLSRLLQFGSEPGLSISHSCLPRHEWARQACCCWIKLYWYTPSESEVNFSVNFYLTIIFPKTGVSQCNYIYFNNYDWLRCYGLTNCINNLEIFTSVRTDGHCLENFSHSIIVENGGEHITKKEDCRNINQFRGFALLDMEGNIFLVVAKQMTYWKTTIFTPAAKKQESKAKSAKSDFHIVWLDLANANGSVQHQLTTYALSLPYT